MHVACRMLGRREADIGNARPGPAGKCEWLRLLVGNECTVPPPTESERRDALLSHLLRVFDLAKRQCSCQGTQALANRPSKAKPAAVAHNSVAASSSSYDFGSACTTLQTTKCRRCGHIARPIRELRAKQLHCGLSLSRDVDSRRPVSAQHAQNRRQHVSRRRSLRPALGRGATNARRAPWRGESGPH